MLLPKADYEEKQSLAQSGMPLFILIAMFPPRSLSLRKALCHTASMLAASLKHKNHHGWHRYPVQLFPKSSCDQLPSYSLNGNNVDPSPRTQLFPSLLPSVLGKQIWVLVGEEMDVQKRQISGALYLGLSTTPHLSLQDTCIHGKGFAVVGSYPVL